MKKTANIKAFLSGGLKLLYDNLIKKSKLFLCVKCIYYWQGYVLGQP